jgi:hypothetical protein
MKSVAMGAGRGKSGNLTSPDDNSTNSSSENALEPNKRPLPVQIVTINSKPDLQAQSRLASSGCPA